MITGCSVHNQHIERLWRDMHKCVTVLFYKLFYFMEHHDLLNHMNEYHLWSLHYVVPSHDEDCNVTIPGISLKFSDSNMLLLKQTIDPCTTSENYGLDLYEQTLSFISTLNPAH